MDPTRNSVIRMPASASAALRGASQMAWFAGLDPQRRPLIRVAQESEAPSVIARCLCGLPADLAVGTPVLLLTDSNDPRPVILGPVSDTVPSAAPTLLDAVLPVQRAAAVDGRRLVLEASQEVVLRCGKGSITLEASGRVVIKGTELVSRALGTNKIRGASVSIN